MSNIFDWQAFLEFAKKIYFANEKVTVVDNAIESLGRIAISRTYYAVYHSSRSFLLTLNPTFEENIRGGSHEAVINAFLAEQNKLHRKIGRKLSLLKEQRVQADYISKCYPPRGHSGNIISALKMAIDSADDINKIIAHCSQYVNS